jgi:hypothetical protein
MSRRNPPITVKSRAQTEGYALPLKGLDKVYRVSEFASPPWFAEKESEPGNLYRYTLDARTTAEDTPLTVIFIGTVVNPRNMRPYFVLALSTMPDFDFGGDFILAVPSFDMSNLTVVGRGWIDTSSSAYTVPALRTGTPRIHTSGAIPLTERGSGLGAVVYTAGALLGAYLGLENLSKYIPGVTSASETAGVCSGAGANEEARAWWEKAVALGLARHFPATRTLTIGRKEVTDEAFVLHTGTVLAAGLVLDITPALNEHLGAKRPGERLSNLPRELAKEVLLNLDLREIQDEQALRYFQSLARSVGANQDEMLEFLHATTSGRRPLQATDMTDMNRTKALRKAGYRTNPDNVFGPLAELE